MSGNVLLWDVNIEQLLRRFAHKGYVTTLTWRRDGKRILSAAGEEVQTLYIWDADTGQLLSEYWRGNPLQMLWSPDGSKLAIVPTPGTVLFADPVTFELQLEFIQHPEGAGKAFDTYAAAWSPDGKQIATGSLNGVVRIWVVMQK